MPTTRPVASNRKKPQPTWPPSPRRTAMKPSGSEALLDVAAATPQDRVLIIGGGGAELLCASLRRGCRSAVGIATRAPLAEPADLVLAPRVASPDQASAVGAQARRAIMAGARQGRLAIDLLGAGALALSRTVARRLRDYGFARARLRARAEGGILLLCDFKDSASTAVRPGKV